MGAHWQTAAHDLLCSRYLLPSSTLCTDGVQTLILGSTSAHPLGFADLSRVKYLIPSELEKKNELCLPSTSAACHVMDKKSEAQRGASHSTLRLCPPAFLHHSAPPTEAHLLGTTRKLESIIQTVPAKGSGKFWLKKTSSLTICRT